MHFTGHESSNDALDRTLLPGTNMRWTRLGAFPLGVVVVGIVSGWAVPVGVMAESAGEEVESDLLHADLPLFGDETEDKWPRAFVDEDSFGCTSRVAFGDWMLRQVGEDADDAEWYRVQNYGVFHCWAMIGRAYRREDVLNVDLKPSFFIHLGTAKRESRELELWAVQMGVRPGSEYLLLARPKSDDRIEMFDVLQTVCPKANTRDARTVDILLTRYCAIDSRASLLSLARQMVQKPSRGTFSFIGSSGDKEDN